MYDVIIPENEFWDEQTETFVKTPRTKIQIEHSLISISKWEEIWHKPYLTTENKTQDEIISYIECMSITKGISKSIYQNIPNEILEEIINYINDSHTATWFKNPAESGFPGNRSAKAITAEVIYYWMIECGIPIEFQKWHLNRLMTLIRVVNAETAPKRKMSAKEGAMERHRLNMERRAKMHSKG